MITRKYVEHHKYIQENQKWFWGEMKLLVFSSFPVLYDTSNNSVIRGCCVPVLTAFQKPKWKKLP